MDTGNQSFNDGGEHRRRSSQEDGRLQPKPLLAHEGVMALDQMRITGSCNEYTEGPTVAPQNRQQKSDPVTSPLSSIQQDTQEERPSDVRSPITEHSQSSTRTGVRSTCSAQRLLCITGSGDQIISTQPRPAALISDEKPVNEEPKLLVTVPGSGESKCAGTHSKCERCSRCRCSRCRRPRALPSCWMCGRRCVCSAQHAVEYCTCVCCVKGLFYHCSADDEDTCADKPFSCSQAHCCIRWTAMSIIAVILPCLMCYFPARGCVAVCQSCYDRATRPGCRCKNVIHCEAVSKPT
ncbi:protein sprouty homolog 2 [Phyllopteryx taeniolatus]|uniref:protein sprouty homolog 2 n=1 Tax=Phyllopteryx taeniolatus TaxID=161469 RepID=UPI002AD52D83|nr:protein sprouty homolog 2 [Phyllopteryx taeniolatus]